MGLRLLLWLCLRNANVCVDCNRSHTEVQRHPADFSALVWTDIPSMSLPFIDACNIPGLMAMHRIVDKDMGNKFL